MNDSQVWIMAPKAEPNHDVHALKSWYLPEAGERDRLRLLAASHVLGKGWVFACLGPQGETQECK